MARSLEFGKSLNGVGEKEIFDASLRLPFGFTEAQLSTESGERAAAKAVLEQIKSLPDADEAWKEKASENFLWMLHSKPFQIMGEKRQLGLITTPENIFQTEMADAINTAAGKLNLPAPVRYAGNKPEYIGGTRRQHLLTTAENMGRAGRKMQLPKEMWFAAMAGGLFHDSGQSALSHVGEQTLKIALAIPEIKDRLRETGFGEVSSSHEERSKQIVKSPEIARSLIEVGVDPKFVADIIEHEYFGLGIFDTLSYLYRDNENIRSFVDGLEEFPKDLIERIHASIIGFNPDTYNLWTTDDAREALSDFLDLRSEAYRRIYTNPETLKIEAMTIDVLTRMLVDGVINVQDFIVNGTDDSIRVHARKVAQKDSRFRHLVDALDGKVLPTTRVVDPNLVHSEFQDINLYEIKQRVVEAVKKLSGRNLSPESFYVVPPFDPTRKTVTVEIDGAPVEIATNKERDPQVHPLQGQMILMFEDSLSLAVQEEIEEVLTGGGKIDESLYIYKITESKLIKALSESLRPAFNSKYTTESETIREEARILWGDHKSFVRLAKRDAGAGAEYFVEAKFARENNDSGKRIDRNCAKRVITREEYDKFLEKTKGVWDVFLLSDIPEAMKVQIKKAQQDSGEDAERSEATEELILKLKQKDNGEVAKVIIRTAHEAVLRPNQTVPLHKEGEHTLSIIIGKNATSSDINIVTKIFDNTNGLDAVD